MSVVVETDPPATSELMELESIRPSQLSQYRTDVIFDPNSNLSNPTNEGMEDPLLDTDEYGRCALHYASLKGYHHVVSWILDEWESKHPSKPRHPQISLEDHDGMTPLHDAVRRLNVDVVKLLIQRGAAIDVPNKHGVPPYLSFNMRELVHGMALKYDPTRYYNIVKFILEERTTVQGSRKLDINLFHPSTGWTMLHHAIFFGSHEAVQYLVDNGADPNQLIRVDAETRNAARRVPKANYSSPLRSDIGYLNKNINRQIGVSALQYAAWHGDLKSVRILVNNGGNLAQPYPDSSKTVIDQLCRRTGDVELENFLTDLFDAKLRLEYTYYNKVTVDCCILAPKAEPRRMAVVSALIRAMPPEGLRKILKHPVLQLYITKQWSQFSIVLYSFMVLHTIFVFFLSSYAYNLVNKNSDPDVWLTVSMLSSACILSLQNLLQFFAEPKWFFMQAKTWLLFVPPTLSIVIAINGLHTSNASNSWVLHVLSVILPLAWIRMLEFFAQLVFRSWGHYALLLNIVLKNVLKVLSVGLVVVAGFSLSFFILFHNNDQFDNPWKALAKTIVMMTGEYEYGDLFGTSTTKNSTDRNPMYDDLPLVTGRIVFIVFVIITSIVLMNLMIALAVSDVQALVSEGELERLQKRAMFIAHWEQAVLKYSNVRTNIVLKCCLRETSSESHIIRKLDDFYPYYSRPSTVSKEVWREIITFYEKNRPDRPRPHGVQALLESRESRKQQLIEDSREDCNADVQQVVPDEKSS